MHAWTLLIISHVVAALTSVLLGAHQVWRRPKGDARHRLLGRVWVVLILWTAVTSFWIRHINDGAFSWLHVLSVVTLVTVTLGVVTARRGNLRAHRNNMVGSWLGACGAMVAAMAVPVRMIPTYAVAQPRGALAFVASVFVVTVVLVAAGSRLAVAVDRRAGRAVEPGREEADGIRA
jgi:uncharacterized membrane protein